MLRLVHERTAPGVHVKNAKRRFLLGAAALIAAALALAPAAGAVLVKLPDGHYAGVQLRRGLSPASIPGTLAARPASRHLGPASGQLRPASGQLGPANCPTNPDNGTLCYLGGPVLHTSRPYLVFWDPGAQIPTGSQAVLEQYLTDVTSSSASNGDVYGVLRQYYDAGGFAAAGQTFGPGQIIHDTAAFPSHCTVAPGYTNCVTDQDIEGELTNLIQQQGLPTGAGPGAPIYFVVTPATTDVCDAAHDCASTTFCGYHSNFQLGGQQIVYAVTPFGSLGPSLNVQACQSSNLAYPQEPNQDPADVIVDDLSHENSESITDPIVDTGWEDYALPTAPVGGSGNETADNCQSYGSPADPAQGVSPRVYYPIQGETSPASKSLTYGTAYDQTINGDHYFTQTEWSNGDMTCEPLPVGAAVTPRFTDAAPATPATSVSFDPTASTAANGISSATWNFGDGTQPSFTVGQPMVVNHTYASPGDYTVTLTLVDNSGDLATLTHLVAIGHPPTAAFSSTPTHAAAGYPVQFNAGASSDPNSGATINTYAWNFGDGTTTTGVAPRHSYIRPGTYTVTLRVTDSLGLTATRAVSLTVLAPGRVTNIGPRKIGSSEYLLVTVSQRGSIRIGSKLVTLLKAGSASFRVGAAPAPHHRLSINVTVLYTPEAGPAVRKTYATVITG